MEKEYKFIISVASICGVIQSIIWLCLATYGCLTYLCIVFVSPYAGISDFFRATFVKLYFEGPKCISDGSYLGKFNEDYKNPEKINLMTPDIIFAIMVVKIIFDLVHLILSILIYSSNKTDRKMPDLVVCWSILTLIMSALDAFLTVELIMDVLKLTKYLNANAENGENLNLREIQFIPLVFGVISSRLVVLWLWNVIVGVSFFFIGLWRKNIFDQTEFKKLEPASVQTSFEEPAIKPHKRSSSLNRLPYHRSYSEWDLYSLEAVTHFNNSPEERSLKSFAQREFHTLSVKQSHAQPDENSEEKNDSTKQDQLPWDLTNEGYVNDEPNTDSPINLNFYQKVQKFEGNQRPIKIIKRPVGKPVRVPVPPPLPSSDSFAC